MMAPQNGVQYGPFPLPQNGLPIKISLKKWVQMQSMFPAKWETSNKETSSFSVAFDQQMEAAHSYREL